LDLPEDDDIIVVNRCSMRGRPGLKVSTVWAYLTIDQIKYVAVFVLPALHERDVDYELERASCCSLEFVCQLHRLALLASATMGFIHSKLRNYLGRDAARNWF
jgi:hypothetical protein